MLFALSLFFAGTISVPAAAPNVPQTIQQTIQVDGSGKVQVDSRSTQPGTSTVRLFQPDGRVMEKSWRADARVLIELEARPVLDGKHPGSEAAAAAQRDQLAQDLMALDVRLQSRTQSKITREYHTLFSGVAATVDSAAIAEIRQLPNVAAVYEDAQVHATLNESVPLIGAPTVWNTYGVNGAGVKVAVIDTGIDYTHPDLGGCLGAACRVAGGYDFVNHDADPRDDHGHGTHVAGIIAANGTLKGVAPGATLLAYKALDQYGNGSESDIIAALEQAVTDGAKVANLSLGGPGDAADPMSQAIDNATAAGMLSVVAAGNSGPSYLSVDSPGTARTALTVGATDKSWVMASFSSRGYTADGQNLVMKPEVVAPGVNIYSTVPATGMLGNPSRYATLSGTSMATPHVAGSAALLLQWNATQSPADIKNRLAGSTRSISGDPFTRGTGGIDLVAAFAAPVLASATHVSFGVVDATSGIVTREQTITIRNTTGTSQALSLSTDSPLPAGVTAEIIPSSLTLPAGGSADVLLRLQVDAAVVPDPPEPLAWGTNFVIATGGQTAHLPAFFFKGSVLALTFDEAPGTVDLVSASGVSRRIVSPGTALSVLVKPGLWDVIVTYSLPIDIVVREQQNVQGRLELSVARAQANRAITSRKVDDGEQPLRAGYYERVLLLGIRTDSSNVPGPLLLISTNASGDFRVSDLSSRFLVAFVGGGPDQSGSRHFTTGWSAKGLSSDVVLPLAGVPYRRLAESMAQPPGASYAYLMIQTGCAVRTSWGGIGLLGGVAAPGELSKTQYLQSSFDPDLPLLPIQQSTAEGFDASFNFLHWVAGPYLNFEDPANLEVDPSPFFDLLDPSSPEAVLGPAVERWDVETPPPYLPIRFANTSSAIWATYGSYNPFWLTHTVSSILRVANTRPSYTLYRAGTLVGTYPIADLSYGVASAAGAHEIRSSSEYSIGGVAGSSQVATSFDTSKSDPNPPLLSRFRIEQNGIRTATPFTSTHGPKPAVRFRATDDFNLASATLEWRQNGATTWTPLALTGSGPDYEAVLTMTGSVDLRVTATDSAGNAFQEEWTPAMIATPAGPPSTPASVQATRSGPTAVTVSWAAAASQVGIAAYRVEKLPGNQVFVTTGPGTSFVDTNVASGSAYFYRVTAVDLDNSFSTPSAYDVATLVDFQDDPVVAHVTSVRGAHVADLRRAVDAVRQAAGLSKWWTSYTPPTGLIRASHFVELRDRLNEARAAVLLPAVQFSDAVAVGAVQRARSVVELRNGVK